MVLVDVLCEPFHDNLEPVSPAMFVGRGAQHTLELRSTGVPRLTLRE